MHIVEQRLLRGRNLYSHQPCLLTLLDLGAMQTISTDALDGFAQRLLALLPSLYDHRCSAGKYAGFAQALRAGTNLAHVVEHVTLALQCLAGTPTSVGRTHAVAAQAGRYRVVCSYVHEQVAQDAMDAAITMVTMLARGEDACAYLRETVDGLTETCESHAIGTSTGAILKAAARRGIPYVRLTPEANLFTLGWGANQKRLQATITGDTGHIAVGIASDKALTKALLTEAGVPVPQGSTVRTLEQAQRAAERLGGLVTIKPLDGNHGRGVTTRCATADDVAAAFARAREHGRSIIVERFICGDDYRILVAGGKVVAAALRRPPTVIGDGSTTVSALVAQENCNPARGEGHTNILTTIALDAAAAKVLAEQGLTFDSVPAAGQPVCLRGNANLSSGGTAEDVTDLLAPATMAMCVRAVGAIGLDVAGVDLVCADITVPLDGTNGAVIEINAAPGIRMHEYPSAGTPRDAGAAIVTSMFGNGDGRIPLIAVTGTNGKTTTTLMIDHVLRQAGIVAGCTTTEGVYVNGQRIAQGDCTGYWSARTVLAAPEVEYAVLETARGGILKRGLAFDRCDVAVVLNISADHLGMDGIETLDDLAQVKAVVAEAAGRAVVLNAEDPYCVTVGSSLGAQVERVYFSCDSEHPVLLRHLEEGGRAAYLQDGALIWADGTLRHSVLTVDALPAAMGGCARHNVANALAASAALLVNGLPIAFLASGLASFTSDAKQNPMRGNRYRIGEVDVIIDYAHNPAAFAALAATARALTKGRTHAVVTTPGDRRDQDIAEIGRICGSGFDAVVFYEWRSEDRGRQAAQRAMLMHDAACEARGSVHDVLIELDCGPAVRHALSRCAPGDVLVYSCGASGMELAEAIAQVDPAGAGRIAESLA